MEVKVVYPFKMIGRYEDGSEVIVGDDNEEKCMCKLCGLEDKYGSLIWYSCYCDEDYVDGEYVGSENFIYD